MKKDTKVLIIVFSIVLTCVLVALGLGYFWWNQKSKKLTELSRKMEKEGKVWGSQRKVSECVSHSLKKDISCGDDLICC